MKIAFVDNLSVGGGLSRFSLKLCESLIENYKDLFIDYYIHVKNLEQIPEIQHLNERVVVIILKSTQPNNLGKRISNKLLAKLHLANPAEHTDITEIEKRITTQYDLAYFPCAHMMKMPSLSIPAVATLHDFNWRYFFGTEIFNNKFTNLMDVEIQKWLSQASCISSSNHVVDEAKLMYPKVQKYPTVIPISQVVVSKDVDDATADNILKQLNIDFPYLIFPGNFYPHKNHLNLFTAFSILKQNPVFKNYKLLLTGIGTDKVEMAIATYGGLRKILNKAAYYDVMGMGYQPNEIIDVLIKKATLLVSPSIYEAICTPALDAWSYGTPTAISDIPPFREHETALGIRSAFFDPMDTHNIAEVIGSCLKELSKIKAEAKISQEKLAAYSWKEISASYMNVFIKATKQ